MSLNNQDQLQKKTLEDDKIIDPRTGTVFGWLSGAALGLIFDYLGSIFGGEKYPTGYSTFILITVFALIGMKVSDLLGSRAPKVLGPIAGIFVTVCVVLFLGTILMR